MAGLLISFVWMVVDCAKIFGAAWAVVAAIIGIVLLPMVWLEVVIYYIIRNNRLANPPGDPNWQRDLNTALKERQYSSRPASEASAEGMVSYADRDEEVEALAHKGDMAGAIRLARTRAAEALDRRNFELAKVYERYLEKFRRGAK